PAITYLNWHNDLRNGWHNMAEMGGTMISEIATGCMKKAKIVPGILINCKIMEYLTHGLKIKVIPIATSHQPNKGRTVSGGKK
ncbi:hypothetical protein, partial [Halalkalibaculum sp. DA384]|uniref:hypothetical protein n=1 Tax=Halalkalibaculum sp. DA384 TaxID=3373606 RepID=UPI0037551AA5